MNIYLLKYFQNSYHQKRLGILKGAAAVNGLILELPENHENDTYYHDPVMRYECDI